MKEEDKTYLELVNRFKTDSDLSPSDQQIMERWKFAHEVQKNQFKFGQELVDEIVDKFDVSQRTARYDIENAQKYFITEQDIDKTFWRGMLLQWQVKGLALSYANDKIKEFNAGIRNLYLILGLHKSGKGIDPKYLQKNIFNFYGDMKRLGLPEVKEEDIIQLVEEIIADENVSNDQKNKILKDAGVDTDKTQ